MCTIRTHIQSLVSLITLILIFSGCNKNEITPEYTSIQLDINFKITSFDFVDDSIGYLTGGITQEAGYIYRTDDAGDTWQLVFTANEKINKVDFFDAENGYACGDSMLLVGSSLNGLNWSTDYNFSFLDKFEKSNLKSISLYSPNSGMIAGDKSLNLGRLYKFSTNKKSGEFNISNYAIENGMFDIVYSPQKDYTLCLGFGAIVKFDSKENDFNYLDIEGDFFTSGCFIDQETILSCGYNGGIYKSNNGGKSWNQVYKKNKIIGKRKHFNAIACTQDGSIFVCGENGIALKSTNYAGSWHELNLSTTASLTSVFWNNKYTYIGTETGKVIRIKNPF